MYRVVKSLKYNDRHGTPMESANIGRFAGYLVFMGPFQIFYNFHRKNLEINRQI